MVWLAWFGLLGCQPKFEIESDLACDADYFDWAGGIATWVAEGKGDGSFDVDPAGGFETRVVGEYSLETGDIEYEISYAGDAWVGSAQASGYGFVQTNGDVDTEITIVRTDVLGDEYTTVERVERTGCEEVRWYSDGDDIFRVDEGTYTDDGFEYSIQTPYGGGEGVLSSDLTYVESQEESTADYTYSAEIEGDGDGYRVAQFDESGADYDSSGEREDFPDGSVHWDYAYSTVDGTYYWDYTVDYYGDGTGTLEGSGFNCEVEFSGWDCVASCDDGEDYSCS